MMTNEDKIAISILIDNLHEKMLKHTITSVGRLTYRFHEFQKHAQKELRQLDETHSQCHRDALTAFDNISKELTSILQRLAVLEHNQ